MLRSMFSGISGLRAHQTKMDVIGNNIANVNTVGFKSSRVTFQEVYNQTIKAASTAAGTGRGGTNPQQIGMGVSVGSIDVLHNSGGPQRTDKTTDLSLDGEGFFVVSDGASNYYTRAGNFDIDPRSGSLVTASGLKVQGWTRNDQDEIITNGATSEIDLTNLSMSPEATSWIDFQGNLDSGLDKDGVVEYTTSIIDSLGEEHNIKLVFSRITQEDPSNPDEMIIIPNQWDLRIEPANTDGKIATEVLYDTSDTTNFPGARSIEFDENGRLISHENGITIPTIGFNNGATEMDASLKIEFDREKLTQNDGESTFKAADSDGHIFGTLNDITIDSTGRVVGLYSNGKARIDAVIAVSRFNNAAGLNKVGDNLFEASPNSGDPNVGVAGTDGRGMINPGAIEMSNVDLAQEFTDMIITQRGFQANSRIITTSDELLQELVNLKR